jgi:hypothetical protein
MGLPTDWTHYIRRVRSFDGLDKRATREVIAALEYFRDALSVDVLQDFQLGTHPIHDFIVPCSVPHLNILAWLAHEIQVISQRTRFLSKLEHPDTFYPTVAEIETAARLRRAELSFGVEPEVQVGESTKRPDFRAHAGNGFVCSYVEVKYKRASVTARRERETILGLRLPSPPFSGVVYQILAPVRLKQLNKEIQRLKQRTEETGEIQEIRDPNVIHLVLGPKAREDEVARWAKENGLGMNTLHGPSQGADEIIRLKTAIMEKKSQLPADYPGIISIKNPFVFRHAQTVYKALVGIEEEMQRIPNLSFVLLHGVALNNFTPLGQCRQPAQSLAIRYKDHIYAEYFSPRRFMVDRVIVLRNSHSVFDDQFCKEAPSRLARSILTGYKPEPIVEVDLQLSESEFERRFLGHS